MNNLRQKFGKRLKEIRHSRGYTQERLSELTGISSDFISLVERGIYAPSFENIEKIAETLDINIHELFVFEKAVKNK